MTPQLKRRVAGLLWHRVLSAVNPFINQALITGDKIALNCLASWNAEQIRLCRDLSAAVHECCEPTDVLITDALDFIDGRNAKELSR